MDWKKIPGATLENAALAVGDFMQGAGWAVLETAVRSRQDEHGLELDRAVHVSHEQLAYAAGQRAGLSEILLLVNTIKTEGEKRRHERMSKTGA